MSETYENIIVDHLVVGPFQTNVYVVGCRQTKKGAIIDAGGNGPGLLAIAKKYELEIEKILQTHAHIDHVAAIHDVVSETSAPIYLHPDDLPLYERAPEQGLFFGMNLKTLPKIDHFLNEGDIIEIGNLRAEVILLPGHSPGSVIFYFEAQHTMLSGDILFKGSIGRTDLPGGDVEAMKKSLKRLKAYPPETKIYCGHGPETTLGEECRTNPFLTRAW